MQGFLEFLRKQGIVGLATGFILGGAVSKVVAALVEDILNPLLGLLLGKTAGLASATLTIGSAQLSIGHFVNVIIDFLVVAAVVYYGFKWLRLEDLDKKS